jgi:hypothetical protein
MDYSWIGPLIGAVGGYLSSRKDDNTTTTTNELPSQFQPLAGGVAQRGIEIGNMPYTQNPYNQSAGFTPYQFQGFDAIAGAAPQAQALANTGAGNLNATLGGAYLNNNPYLDNMVSQTAGDVQGRMSGGAFSSGSFGNAGVAEAGARGIAKAENDLRYGAYNDERARQMQGLGLLGQVQQAQFAPGQQLMNIGSIMQQQGQNVLDRNSQEFQNWQNWPFRTYDAMRAPFSSYGSTSRQVGPGGNPVAGMLGGAMLGGRMQNAWNSGGNNQSIWSPGYDDTTGQSGGWTGQR